MEITKKIIAVQDAMEPIKKNKQNTHFKNTYFDKDTLLSILSPILEANGLRLFQPLTEVCGRPAMKMLFVDKGDLEEFSYTFPMPDLQDPQKMGGAITYYQRYTLVSFFGLESEDDDGNVASGKPVVEAAKPSVAPPAAPQSTPAPQQAQSTGHGICKDCGANKVLNPKTGKVFCEKKCWLNPQEKFVDELSKKAGEVSQDMASG